MEKERKSILEEILERLEEKDIGPGKLTLEFKDGNKYMAEFHYVSKEAWAEMDRKPKGLLSLFRTA